MCIFVPARLSIQSFFKQASCQLAVLCFLFYADLPHALEFEFINKGVIPLSNVEMDAIEQAGIMWSSYFSDPITIKINVDWQKEEFFVSDSILASVQVGRTTAPAVMVRDSLLAEADATERSLLSSLPMAIPVLHTGAPMNDISLSLANAKALGITPANDPHFGAALANHADAHISFNLRHAGRFFYDQNRVESDKYDFVGIAMHEIGHALGFTSIVDVQWMNPGVRLNPMLLDVFRFAGGIMAPSLTFDKRQTLPGYAMFYDEKLNYAPFGSGLAYFDPIHCGWPLTYCSASHWEDMSGNLMTSAGKGKPISIEADDIHAIDRIGVDQMWRSGIPLIHVKAEFYDINDPLPEYDNKKFSTKTEAPPFDSVTPNFGVPPTHAFHISLDGHAGAGFAVFIPKEENRKIPAIDFWPRDGNQELDSQWEAEPAVEMMPHFPPRFSHFYFESKNSSYRFKFISTFSNYGAIFDPELGPYGGFRLSGFLDGDLDGNFSESAPNDENRDKPTDYDATVTMLLLLQKPHKIDDGIAGVSFAIKWQGKQHVQDNILHLIDNSAFGAPSAYNNSSSYQEAWEMRVQQLEGDTEPGRDIAI
ncbi:hypothetical protein FKG94_15910 [Exilibacterium tricleocarpae]|uniref:Uncharacterized protein n=1 Tax=Exilibacterium tricleocarpae TaxID=2591008 RepID=A0A545TBB2_9GAMM|nr:NF038122 family metalloprotease [Exilibacterium tricleocarpae]TQV74502.1 hypothetical protein FKG94_15910 [Exilibacterium tricleocarpae]